MKKIILVALLFLSVTACESLYEKLSNKGIKCAHYHGGMSKEDKDNSHKVKKIWQDLQQKQ